MVAGSNSPEALAAQDKGRLCRKQSELAAAVTGQIREHHRFLIQTHLEHLEFLEQQIGQFDQHIARLIQEQSLPDQMPATPDTAPALSWQQAMALLDPIPGVARQSAELLKRRSWRRYEPLSKALLTCAQGQESVLGIMKVRANNTPVKRLQVTVGCAGCWCRWQMLPSGVNRPILPQSSAV